MFSKLRITLFLVAAVLLFGGVPGYAATITFDNSGPTTGTVSYAGGTGALVGTNIDSWDIVDVTGTGATDGQYYCQNCTLNFSTGANTLNSSSFYTWAGGGYFTMTDTI
jgi:hypothetical protein